MQIVSLAALTILDAGPAGQIRAAAEAGFRSVGLRLNPLVPSDLSIVGDARREREILRLLAKTGLEVLEIGVFPIAPALDVQKLIPILAFSARIGARFIVCPVEDDDIGRRRCSFVALCDAALPFKLVVLAEFNPYSAMPRLEDALALVGSAARPNAALCIDALHLSRSGGAPSDLVAVPPLLLPLVHFCDARAPDFSLPPEELRRESRTARLLPGEGELPLDALLDALPPDVAISVEAPSARDASLPPDERARRALSATRAVLDRHHG
jgi:sugar phosphate isomerase/epimerase